MNLQTFFENIFNALNRQDNHVIIMVVFLVFIVTSLVLRVVAHLHFRGALIAFQVDTRKEINIKGDVANLKCKLLRKAVAEYIRTAERAAAVTPTAQIVERAVAGMSLFGWKYEAVLPFVKSMETGFLLVGLVLALAFNDFAFMYGAVAVISFVLTRLFTAFFNADGAKQQLIDEMHLYIEREIGRFFASDSGGAILRLKGDLTDAINKQSVAYKETMENIGHIMASAMSKVSDSMTEATSSIGPAVATAMDEKLIDMNDTLTTTLQNWEKALSEATRQQTAMNDSSERISHASTRLQSSAELLATHMHGHSNALSEQLMALVGAVEAIKESVNLFATQQEALTQQAKYIECNQQTLETSLHSYEDSLRTLTGSLGEGLGAFINLHAQTSAQVINDTLKSNIDKAMNLYQGTKRNTEDSGDTK